MAAKDAVGKIKRRLADFLAERYQAKPADVRFEAGRVHVGTESLTFDEAIGKAYAARVSLSATGFYATPKIRWDKATAQGRPFFYCAYGAAVAEVAIDTLTGENRLLRVDIPARCRQVPEPGDRSRPDRGRLRAGRRLADHGGTGVDDRGRLMTHAPSTYKIPACSGPRAGDEHRPVQPRRKCRRHDLSLQGGRRPPLMLGISALMALSDAVASVGGYRTYPFPIRRRRRSGCCSRFERVRQESGAPHDRNMARCRARAGESCRGSGLVIVAAAEGSAPGRPAPGCWSTATGRAAPSAAAGWNGKRADSPRHARRTGRPVAARAARLSPRAGPGAVLRRLRAPALRARRRGGTGAVAGSIARRRVPVASGCGRRGGRITWPTGARPRRCPSRSPRLRRRSCRVRLRARPR